MLHLNKTLSDLEKIGIYKDGINYSQDYEEQEELTNSGSIRVTKCTDKMSGKTVAIKRISIVRNDPSFERKRKEVVNEISLPLKFDRLRYSNILVPSTVFKEEENRQIFNKYLIFSPTENGWPFSQIGPGVSTNQVADILSNTHLVVII